MTTRRFRPTTTARRRPESLKPASGPRPAGFSKRDESSESKAGGRRSEPSKAAVGEGARYGASSKSKAGGQAVPPKATGAAGHGKSWKPKAGARPPATTSRRTDAPTWAPRGERPAPPRPPAGDSPQDDTREAERAKPAKGEYAKNSHARYIRANRTHVRRSPSSPAPQGEATTGGTQRLQKLLAQAGLASRRASEGLITEGRVTVNGETIREMGTKADLTVDDVRVDGRRIKAVEQPRYVLLYKPTGYMSTRKDPQRRPTVIDLIRGVHEYVYPVGRLDFDTEGLLLLTNDGILAARLTHPRHRIERSYEARLAGMPDQAALERLRNGIPLDGHRTLPAEAVLLNSGRRDRDGVLHLTIREGRNRQVRRMCEAVGHPVRSLRRTRIGPLTDKHLKPGHWRELTPDEVTRLKRATEKAATLPRRAPPRRPLR
jgi:23S rRNA pseudouridine2605 synthase